MNAKPLQRSDKLYLALLFLFLFVWFRFEQFFHEHPVYLSAWILLSFVNLSLLFRSLENRSKYLIALFWIVICSFVFFDLIHRQRYREFSDQLFLNEIDRSNEQIHIRADFLIKSARDAAFDIADYLEEIPSPLQSENIFLNLYPHFVSRGYAWAIYGQEGQLLSWSGQVPHTETYLDPGSEETSVYALLHQRFLKLKRAVEVQGNICFIVIFLPMAADYGFENRYLENYNSLIDGLTIRPTLFYNSQPVTASANHVIRTIRITPDFSIATLYEKSQYTTFIESRFERLHWWIELASLLFFLTVAILLFFEFLRKTGIGSGRSELIFDYLILTVVCFFSAFSASKFGFLSSDLVFQPIYTDLPLWFFRSAGNYFLNAFFLLVVVFAFVLFLKSSAIRIGFRYPARAVLQLLFLFSALFLLSGYFRFQEFLLSYSSLDLFVFSLDKSSVSQLALLFGSLWLDVGVTVLVAVLFALALSGTERNRRNFFLLLLLQIVAIFLGQKIGGFDYLPPPLILLLYVGAGVFVFFLPKFWLWFQWINLLSRFVTTALLFALISFLMHFVRFHYLVDLQKSYVADQAALQVQRQEEFIQIVVQTSKEQLDHAIANLSIDPKIPDLAYRLWTQTDLARFGYKSSVEIYDLSGNLLNRFALGIPDFSNVTQIARGEDWTDRQMMVPFGNVRKPVLMSGRILPQQFLLVVAANQDFENLPFIGSTNPFQELFRGQEEIPHYLSSLHLNVYDASWHPVFLSNADLSLPINEAKKTLGNLSSLWMTQVFHDQKYHVYYFRLDQGYGALLTPAVSPSSHLMHFFDLLLFSIFWLAVFTLVLIGFFRELLSLHFRTHTAVGFNFFQKLLLAFLVFSMIPMLAFSVFIRNYVWEKKINEVTSRALTSFTVASKVVSDYLLYRTQEEGVTARRQVFSDDLLEWIGQVIQQDLSLYGDRYLLATSYREFFSAGLLGEQIQAHTYQDLFLKGQKYSITEIAIGKLRYLNVSGQVHSREHLTDMRSLRASADSEVISIPFLIDEKSVDSELLALRQHMVLVGGALILFAVLLGYFLANRFSRPVKVLIQGTDEMSRGNLQFRITERYQDEFQQLVHAFNAMADSLHGQQQALEQRRAYTENILNNITTAVISVNRTMAVTKINPAAREMFGLDPGYHEAFDRLIEVAPEPKAVFTVMQSFFERRDLLQVREISVHKENTPVHFRLVFVPLFENGEWNGALLLVEDITDIIRSNRLSAWAEMARRVAHEVKNPLTPIQLAVEHLMKVYEDRSENFDQVIRSCSDAVLKQVRTLRRLVSDFSQYGSTSVLNKSAVDMNEFLKDLTGTYKQHLPEKIEMEERIERGLPALQIDREKIRGALMNIIENGLQAMHGQGKMIVEAGNGDGRFLTIKVSDTGQGIPSDILPRLFEPYFSTKSGGTGLGLAIARKNIEDHGGKIHVESIPQKGTTVTVELPV